MLIKRAMIPEERGGMGNKDTFEHFFQIYGEKRF